MYFYSTTTVNRSALLAASHSRCPHEVAVSCVTRGARSSLCGLRGLPRNTTAPAARPLLQTRMWLAIISGAAAESTCSSRELPPWTPLQNIRRGTFGGEHSKQGLTVTQLAARPMLFHLDHVLTNRECDLLIRRSADRLRAARTYNGVLSSEPADANSVNDFSNSGGSSHPQHGIRCSSTATFTQAEIEADAELWHVHSKLILAARFPDRDAELLQITQYFPGQYYGLHADSSAELGRMASLLVYLNDVGAGGETVFPLADGYSLPEGHGPPASDLPYLLDVDNVRSAYAGTRLHMADLRPWCNDTSDRALRVPPRAGSALLWYSHGLEHSLDFRALHGACPLHAAGSVKYVAQLVRRLPASRPPLLLPRYQKLSAQSLSDWSHCEVSQCELSITPVLALSPASRCAPAWPPPFATIMRACWTAWGRTRGRSSFDGTRATRSRHRHDRPLPSNDELDGADAYARRRCRWVQMSAGGKKCSGSGSWRELDCHRLAWKSKTSQVKLVPRQDLQSQS